jgi:hypothetical protein
LGAAAETSAAAQKEQVKHERQALKKACRVSKDKKPIKNRKMNHAGN